MFFQGVLAIFATCSFCPGFPFSAVGDRVSPFKTESEGFEVISSPLADNLSPSLRSLARDRDFYIGSAVNVRVLAENASYREVLSREFNIVTAENAMKFRSLRPQRDRFDFTAPDRLVAFAETHQVKIHGHVLVWHLALPKWLRSGDWSREEAIALLENHIKTVVGRYRGRIVAWDVVNEAIADDGTLRDSFWLRTIGPEYIEIAFRQAREADPEALLIYNDYGGEGLGDKSEAIYQLARSLLAKNVPIDGIGLQMHVSVESPPNPQNVAENMRRLANLGLAVQISEMDVRIEQPSREGDYERQARVYQSMLSACLVAENCNTFVTWGFSDRHSWIPGFFKGWGEALLFDRDYQPKPAYYGLQEALIAIF
ncbi:MAG: endo-1,4-beta-xylanase [Spirulina sp.]